MQENALERNLERSSRDFHNNKVASLSNEKSHINSQQVEAIVLYSSLAEDLETVSYFLDFQEIRESPMKIQKQSKSCLCVQPTQVWLGEKIQLIKIELLKTQLTV